MKWISFPLGCLTAGAKGRMFASTYPLLFIAVVVRGGQNEKCDVYPKDPVISMGDDIQVMFKAPDNSLCSNVPLYDPEKLFWKLNDEKIDESQYTMVNSTIPSVVIQNFTLRSGMVTCHITVGRKIFVLGGTNIKVLFPPVKPTNLSCVTVLFKSFTCYWDSGEDTLWDTIYTVSSKVGGSIQTCMSKSSPCSFKEKDILHSAEIWVTARSSQGAVDSDVLTINNIYSTVKIGPPQTVAAEPLFNSVELKVTWEKPEDSYSYPVLYEVRYSYQQGGSSHKRVRESTRPELYISVEGECTQYTISVRGALRDDWTPVWSDWSPDVRVISPLDVHSRRLLLWRKIHWPDESRNRTVQLMWKGVPASCEAIEGYRVTLRAENNHKQDMLFNPADTKASITVDEEAYTVRIVAYRQEKVFFEDTTTIPAAREVSGFLPVEAAQVFSHDGQIHISWKEPSQSPRAYMVDWSAGDDYSWQETQNTSIAFSGQPLKLYNISVTPLYGRSPGQEATLLAYSQEGAPGAVSWVRVSEVETTRALVRWAAVPRGECCGFAVNYTVFYAAAGWPEQGVTVDGALQEVRLGLLRPATTYRVHVMASSVAGGTNSSNTVFKTLRHGPSFMTMLGLFSGLGIILFLMIGLCCFVIEKKRNLKSVPNPGDSEAVSWPPHYCRRPILMPFEESFSEKLRISMCNGTSPSPAPMENTQLVSPDGQPDPAPGIGPGGTTGSEEPSRSPPYVWDCPAPEAWDRGMTFSPHSQTARGRGPASPYLKNCVLSANGRVYLRGEKPAPSSGREGGTLPDPRPQQSYVSVDMFQKGLFHPV
ncbi:interleukin-6 receptor subunit beta-like isoform X1 [Anguilla anguilla]|uniref:interleukin-6 receptor subunit beta-like isoform X1 n=2 Tax=Anguilla anguilla TaxID=7936 RepID=UPI0015A846B3|nr:interleukin-6 receptor subunit beta-like isoform X1 [Anguilla anguilla]